MLNDAGALTSSIAVDVMGSDLGPSEIIAGVALALGTLKNLPDEFILVGDEAVINPLLKAEGILKHPIISVFHASEIISMDDKPLKALKTKKDSSMVRAIELVKAKTAQIVVSCGNTGSLMAGGTLKLRPIPGISRPALGTIIPNETGHWVLADAGANPTPTAEHMVGNAILGKNYCKAALQIENPRVGLVTIGTEEGKGTELIQQTHQLLKEMDDIINYIGPIEGFQLFDGSVDVGVCDGFTGNVMLKSCEGLYKVITNVLRKELKANPMRTMGAALSSGAYKALKKQLSPDQYAGAPLLGLNGNVLKAHGSSDRNAIVGALRIATRIIAHDMDIHIKEDVVKYQAMLHTNKDQDN